MRCKNVFFLVPRNQTNLSIPDGLADKVDEFIEDSRWGYTSRNEVARQAIREFLQRHQHGAEEPDAGSD